MNVTREPTIYPTRYSIPMSDLPIDPEDYQKGDDAQDGQYHHATAQAAMMLPCNLLVRLLRSNVFSESSKAAPSATP